MSLWRAFAPRGASPYCAPPFSLPVSEGFVEKSTRVASLIRRFVDLSFAHPLRVILLFVLIGGGCAYVATGLVLRGSFVELLPQSAREVQDLNLVSKKAGGDGYLVVQVTGAPLETLQAFAHDVAPKLEAHQSEIRYVEYRYDIEFFRQRGLWLLPAEKLQGLREDLKARIDYEVQTANPLFVDLLDQPPPTFEEIEKKYGSEAPQSEFITSRDGKELYLFVKPTGLAGDLEYSRRLLAKVQQTCEAAAKAFPGVRTDYTGAYRIRLEEDEVMKRDLSFASVLSGLIAIFLILSATRRGSALLAVGAPVAIGLSVTFAVAQLSIGYLNVVTGFLVAILIGLGIEYGIHLSMRYWEERRLLPAREAMRAAMQGTWSGALTSAFTNAAAFFVLVFAKFHAFVQFGFIAGLGVLLVVLSAYACGPAILAIAERVRPLQPLAPEKAEAFQSRRYRPWPTAVLVLLALSVLGFAGYSVYAAKQLEFESDLRKLKGDSPATRLDDHIAEQIGVKITPAILLVDNLEAAAKVTQIVQEVQASHGDKTAFHRVASLGDLVPTDVENRQREIDALGRMLANLPETLRTGKKGERLDPLVRMAQSKPYGVADVPLEVRRRFESLDGDGQFVLLFPRYSMYDTDEIRLWADQIAQVVDRAAQAGIQVPILDGNLIAARVFSLVREDGPYILWSAAAVVFAMIWISLRSFKRALLVGGPLFTGMVCLAGGMHLFGVNLNFINAVVLPNLLAIAVDNSVHLFHRYEEEGPGSLGHVVRHTGFAAVVATLSNAAGYGALLVATHQGLRSIGQLAVLGVVCTFMGTTVFFPALLALIERWRSRGGKSQGGSPVRSLEPAATAPKDEPKHQTG